MAAMLIGFLDAEFRIQLNESMSFLSLEKPSTSRAIQLRSRIANCKDEKSF